MKKQLGAWLICSALLMSTSAVVVAQPLGQDYQDQNRQDQNHRDQKHRQDQQGRHDQNHRDMGMYDRGRSEGWYRKGGHMPTEYRGKSYVVTDWRSEHLRAPRRGYHYVRSDNGDLILVAITTGVIASIIAHH